MGNKKITWQCEVNVITSVDTLDPNIQILIKKAKEASHIAYAKYSKFHVGASLLLNNGAYVVGCNQENAAFPLGTCAEQVALHNAWSNHPDQKIISMAVYAKDLVPVHNKPISPCGACRQVITEFEQIQSADIEIYLTGNGRDIYHVESGKSLLPFYFDGSSLSHL